MIVEQALYPDQFEPEDIIAIGRRFYAIESHKPYMMGYERVMLRNLATGSRAVYEFRMSTQCDVLREEVL